MLEGNDGGIRSYHVVPAGLSQAENLRGCSTASRLTQWYPRGTANALSGKCLPPQNWGGW